MATGSRHHRNTMSLRYPPRTHQPRPSGSLILIGTQKKGMTCPETSPTWSSNSCRVCSSTTNTQCPCTSRHRTPAAIPKPQGLGALGCRILGSLGAKGGQKKPFPLQVGLQVFNPVSLVSFSLLTWTHWALVLNHAEVQVQPLVHL